MQFAMHDTGHIGDVLRRMSVLILDAMRGDSTLFTTADGIERLWEVSARLLEAAPPVRFYDPIVGTERQSTNSSLQAPGGCRSRGVGGIRTPWVPDRS